MVRAKHFVLATGGLENPRILLLSNRQQKSGLGNAHDLVGRYFMEHPRHVVGQIVPTNDGLGWSLYDADAWRRKDPVRAKCALTPTPELQREHRLLNVNISLQPIYLGWGDGFEGKSHKYVDLLGQYLRNYGVIGNRSYRSTFAYNQIIDYCRVVMSSEQNPNRESRVFLSEAKDVFGQNKIGLDWRLTDLDVSSLETSVELFARQIGKAGIGRMQVDIQVVGRPGGHHHMGTTRMSEDPRLGVVDADCRLHGMDNFYIAGSSVFPTSGAVNPTFTIAALALRLSDHLKERMA